LKKFLLEQSLAVRTFILPEVESVVKNVIPTYDSVEHYSTNIVNWLMPVIDLSEFYVYPMNGITEGLNWWTGSSEHNIWSEVGEYQWVEHIRNRSHPTFVYQSVPSAIDGNFKKIINNAPAALDLAYVGSTAIKKLELPSNVKYAFYSLSKSFGVGNIRTGWFFSKQKDQRLHNLVYGAKYYNYFAHRVAEEIISNFSIDYVFNKLQHKQKDICNQLNLIPSDSVWLGTTIDPEYSKFRRRDNVARICLAGVYK
jgi:hypothetical protein